jgi:cyclopropane fatty-acyl-phospholipid synthase-like methyltransferase
VKYSSTDIKRWFMWYAYICQPDGRCDILKFVLHKFTQKRGRRRFVPSWIVSHVFEGVSVSAN